jgi:hypothetical protein
MIRIVFRVWHDVKSVCNGTNHSREYKDGSIKWFEGCPYSNPELSHKKLKDKFWQEVA